jgi:hypothetical protein
MLFDPLFCDTVPLKTTEQYIDRASSGHPITSTKREIELKWVRDLKKSMELCIRLSYLENFRIRKIR